MDMSQRIERRLKLHELRVLLAVVEEGSMGKAAERLATSQPAISRAIADLEHSLGVRLLDRDLRGVVPTPYGRALVKRSIAAFDELSLGIKDLEFLADPTAGEVRIAAPIVTGAAFLSGVIDRLARLHPRVVCHLLTAEVETIYRALQDREVDLVVTRMDSLIAKDHLQTEVLYTGRRLVVAAAENPWSQRRRVRLADLMNEPWTLPPPDSEPGAHCAEDFRAAGLDVPHATLVTYTDIARVALVARGRFLTIAGPSSMALAGGNSVKALPIELASAPGSFGIVTLKNRTLTPVAQLFIDCARDTAKSMAPGKRRLA
jgi:DNA-binding transcriptional LysR family regulator